MYNTACSEKNTTNNNKSNIVYNKYVYTESITQTTTLLGFSMFKHVLPLLSGTPTNKIAPMMAPSVLIRLHTCKTRHIHRHARQMRRRPVPQTHPCDVQPSQRTNQAVLRRKMGGQRTTRPGEFLHLRVRMEHMLSPSSFD